MDLVVIGNGTMGRGISSLLREKGIEHSLVSARAILEGDLESVILIKNSKILLECCREDFELKSSIIHSISNMAPNAIVGSCTSSLSISKLQASMVNPDKFCGVHFMNPPRQIKTVELISGEKTSTATKDTFSDLLLRLGAEVYSLPDTPGFVLNSILISMINQAAKTLSNTGLTAVEVDKIMVNVCAFKMGPLATADLIGLDVVLQILVNLQKSDPLSHTMPAKIITKLVSEGKLGRKTKLGFYKY